MWPMFVKMLLLPGLTIGDSHVISQWCFIIIILFKLLFYVYKCFACVCICVLQACGAHGSQKRASDLMELELQVVVSCHVGAGHQTWVLYRSTVLSTAELLLQPLLLTF